MFSKEIFSSRLSALRASAGVSQADLARAVGVGKTAVCMMERGERAASIEVLWALADYFQVSIDYLVGRSDAP